MKPRRACGAVKPLRRAGEPATVAAMELQGWTLGERPDLAERLWDFSAWPTFMTKDPIGNAYYAVADQAFRDYVMVFLDESGEVAAKAFSAPFAGIGTGELFDDGWDGVLHRALRTRIAGEKPDSVSAVEIAIRSDLQGKGLSSVVVSTMRSNAARLGFTELLAPVRPNGKRDPDQPMAEYAATVREDGLPSDPWLRVHVRAGGQIVQVAPRSMVIPGTLAEWRAWTGLPFDTSGTVHVPAALAPVMCDVAHDVAVYVEPNVWVRHALV